MRKLVLVQPTERGTATQFGPTRLLGEIVNEVINFLGHEAQEQVGGETRDRGEGAGNSLQLRRQRSVKVRVVVSGEIKDSEEMPFWHLDVQRKTRTLASRF